ncbi:MAG: hypothetical protein HFH87_05715 [Lachnospiraceae bacterium]|nr:hypothetical protein [Lachnospiraceae bacterium]
MKKRILAGVICLTILLSGCGNSTKIIEGDVTMKESDDRTETGEAAGTQQAPGTEKSNVSEPSEGMAGGTAEDEAVSYKGYAFIHDGAVIEMDGEAAAAIEQLGDPDSYFEAPSCAFEGIDRIYTYGSFELDTYPRDGKDYVSCVIFKDDTIATPEGIGIGDSVARMEEAYGTGWTDRDGMAVYEKDGMKLCFILDGEEIVSIEYRSRVLDN